MAETTKTLRRRVRSVTNTRKITRAMEMVSAAKLRRTQAIVDAGMPYANKLQELLGRLAGSAGEFADPLFQKRDVQKVTLLLFTGDRGLCGSFNNNIIDQARQFVDEKGAGGANVYLIGKKGRDFFQKRGCEIVASKIGLQGKVDGDVTRAAAKELRDLFLSGATDQVFLLYNAYISQIRYEPRLEQFLPLDPQAMLEIAKDGDAPQKAQGELEYIFEPDQKQLFARLLPRYLESKLYITLANTLTAEHTARRMAMSNATKNCGELTDTLTLKMNKARQAAITKEILEVVTGAEALKG